jgi:flagellar protein FlbD
MIELTRINHTPLVLNCDLIEFVEVTPDTVISLVTGQKLRVLESASEVVEKVIEFRRRICGVKPPCSSYFSAALIRPTDSDGAEDEDPSQSSGS